MNGSPPFRAFFRKKPAPDLIQGRAENAAMSICPPLSHDCAPEPRPWRSVILAIGAFTTEDLKTTEQE